MAHYKRKRLLVDPKVQGLLVLRVVLYWLACIATMEFLRLTWLVATGPEQPSFVEYFTSYDWRAAGGRLLLASVLLAPITWDMLNFSNRFAGPVFRMRRVLREVARGGAIEHVQLRRGDYWHGLADDLNAALKQLASPQSAPTSAGKEQQDALASQRQNDKLDAECCLADDFTAVR